MNIVARPPALARRLLGWLWPADSRAAVLAELDEEYARFIVPNRDSGAAGWYWRQVLRSIPPAAAIRLRRLRPSGLAADVRFGWRMLRRQPWSTFSIAATLALGIGAPTAIYAVFNYAMFRPVPGVSTRGQLVHVAFLTADRKSSTSADRSQMPALRAAAEAAGMDRFASACCDSDVAVSAPAGSQPSFLNADFVTGQFFEALGVKARIGRLLSDEEADTGSHNVAVISEHLWRTAFNEQPGALGQTIDVNGHPFVVIGITSSFRGWSRSTPVGATDVWLPGGAERVVTGDDMSIGDLIGRVPSTTPLTIIEQRFRATYAELPQRRPARFGPFLPFVDPGLLAPKRPNSPVTRLYWLLMTGVTLLLVLACANAANLLLARAASRSRDTAVRLAIGGSRWRVARQFLVESIGLSVLACALGLGAAAAMMTAVRGMRLVSYFPDLEGVAIDGRVVAFSVAVSAATVLVFGVLPSMIAARTDIRGVLARGGRGAAAPHRLRRALVVAQIALSLALVAGASVLNRSLANLLAENLGTNLDQLMQVELRPYYIGYDDAHSEQVIQETMDGLRRAGFADVAVSYPNPLTLNGSRITVKTGGMPAPADTRALESTVSPDFFKVMGIPLKGRTFTDAERREPESINPMPVVVSETLARQLFGGAGAIGHAFELTRFIGMVRLTSTALVIGVAGDTRSGAVRDAPRAEIYYARRSTFRFGAIIVRSPAPLPAAATAIRRVVHDTDAALPITSLRPLADEVAEDLSEDRMLARLGAIVAALAAWLAATGVMSVISHVVVERKRDFGIRRALGASAIDILRNVLAGVVGQSAWGIGLGLALYWEASRWLASRLYGLGALDPVTVGAATAGLFAIAIVAAVLPARRACDVDPATALRAD